MLDSQVRIRRWSLPISGTWFAVLALVAMPLHAAAQGTVTGTVTELGTQRPLANAQVYIEGTSFGSLSNARGQFLILNVPAGEHTVRAELIGFAASEATVTVQSGQTATTNFQLRQTALALDQIVVTGAGAATERRRLGNQIATVDMREMEAAPVTNMSEILSAREPGVIGLPSGGVAGEGTRIRIRGSASLSQSNEPVIYIDGIRADNSQGFGPGIGSPGGSPSRLDDLNPDAIERIEILKGAAAATLYGTQASNGVIQIFTKRGQAGTPQYNVSIEQGTTSYDISRFDRHAGFVRAQGPTDGLDVGVTGIQDRWGISVDPWEVFEVDMIGPQFSTGYMQTYTASVTGGSQAVTYFVSGRFASEDGPYDGEQYSGRGLPVSNDKSERMQFNANVELFPTDNVRVRVSSNYTEMDHEVPDTNNNIFGVLSSIINSQPDLATEDNLFGSPAFATTRENWHRRTMQDVQRFGGAFTTIWQAASNISVDATVGIDFVNQRSVRFIPFGWDVDNYTGSNVAGSRTVGDRNHREVTLDLKANWGTAFAEDWTADFVVGGQGFLTRTLTSDGNGNQFPAAGLEVTEAGALQTVGESFLEEASVGVLGQAQIGYQNFAFFTVGARYDEHSAFGETAGGALYPKVSVSIVPSDLPGWDNIFSTFRIRSAYGTSGLQPGAFDQFTTFAALASAEGAGVAPSNLGNPDLKPETSSEWEVGTELGVFDDRLSLEATYWNRTVNDVLVDRQFAPSGGFRFTQLDNIGEMKSWGVEIGTNAVAVASPNFSANVFASASFLRERITDLGGAPPLKVGGSYPRYRQFTREGYHPGAFFGPVIDNSAETAVHLGDCNPLTQAQLEAEVSAPLTPSDLQPYVLNCGTPESLENYLGKPVPDWQGSFGTNLTFLGDVSLNTLFEYRFGNFQIHDLDGAFRRSHPLIGRNTRESAEVDAILRNPASTTAERAAAADKWVRELAALSPYDGLNEIHDADWLRLREVSLTYRLPVATAERLGASSLSLSAAARNLALWTKFPGTDPELNTSSGDGEGGLTSNFNVGTVGWGVPLPRRFSFTIRAGF